MTVIYFEDDASLTPLHGKHVAVIGYDALGQALALNLYDSGVDVIVGSDRQDEQDRAAFDQLPVLSVSQATAQADTLIIVTPDDLLPTQYIVEIAPHLRRGQMLLFTSGFTLAHQTVEAPQFVDVGLLSPRSAGEAVRYGYQAGVGSLAFVSVVQDATRQAFDRLLAAAMGAGLLRAGAMEVTPEQESTLNLFVQSAVIPAFHHIMVVAGELLVNHGLPPEAAFADLHISGKFFDYLLRANRDGLMQSLLDSPILTQYASLTRMSRFAELRLERMMEQSFEEVRSGQFAREWQREHDESLPRLMRLRRQEAERSVWEFEQQTLDLIRGR
jgi:ketol-acid reductoisomerase